MATAQQFVKMHSLGNDFIILDAANGIDKPKAHWVAAAAARRFWHRF